jgi:DNA helicase-2/ATP-dependent DNA helicase PcrA
VNFLNEVSLITDQDTDKPEDKNTVTLMTVHASKGLEFTYIYIVGMEENLFPSMMVESERDLEEERRLFYVAITRAKERCMITYAKSRFRNGQTQFSNPSRFIYDVDKRYLRLPQDAAFGRGGIVDPYSMFDDARPYSSRTDETSRGFASNKDSVFGAFKKREIIKTPVPKQTHKGTFKPVSSASKAPAAAQDVMGFYPGERVLHSTFGEGTVLEITGDGDNRKARIDFDDFGEKQLLLKYARLSKA